MRSRPFPVVIAAPSGAGKTSLTRALVERNPGTVFSISATTRPRRNHEVDCRDYFFVSHEEFERMAKSGELLEWAEVHGRKYGTPRRSVEEPLGNGKTVVLDVDVQGARSVRAAFSDAVLIFVLPPSVEELQRRLSGRGSEDDAERRRRLATAWEELGSAHEFDYVVVNDDFEAALSSLQSILSAERQRRTRFTDFDQEINALRTHLAGMLERNE